MPVEIKNASKLTDLKWLNLFDISYRDKSGRNKSWQVVTRASQPKCVSHRFTEPDAVVIVAFHTTENKLVLTREYRVPLADFEYGFPAGLVDDGEGIEQAVRRELKEETGLELIRVISHSPPVYSSAGMTDESVAMVYVECSGRPSTAGNSPSELIEVDLVSPSQAARLCGNRALKFDAKAWLVLYNYSKTGCL
jgi:ADP-ribose pyrophosphatase